jgi:hypothetical protein
LLRSTVPVRLNIKRMQHPSVVLINKQFTHSHAAYKQRVKGLL